MSLRPARTCCSHIPLFRKLHVLLDPDPDLRIVPHRVLGLPQPLVRRAPRPQVRLRIALLQHPFAPRQVPATQRQLRLRVARLRRLGVPRYGPPGVHRTAQITVLVALPELVL